MADFRRVSNCNFQRKFLVFVSSQCLARKVTSQI
jgi:hypothetical protein